MMNYFDEADVVHRYTRKQAIEDGVLIDLTQWAKQTGLNFPVACTAAVWSQYIVPPPGTKELGQSERGRAHDVLWMLFIAIRKSGDGNWVMYKVLFLNEQQKQQEVQLKAICGPGDEGEPVITIMLPNED